MRILCDMLYGLIWHRCPEATLPFSLDLTRGSGTVRLCAAVYISENCDDH